MAGHLGVRLLATPPPPEPSTTKNSSSSRARKITSGDCAQLQILQNKGVVEIMSRFSGKEAQPKHLHSEESSDDCAHGGDMSSSRSLRPWPRRCTIPHEDRRRTGPGRRRASCTTRTRTGRLLLPSRCSSSCSMKSSAGGGLPAWQSRRGRRSGYSDHTMEQLADVAPMVPSLAVPEPQMVDQLVAMVKHVDSVVPEQIIAVPKISWAILLSSCGSP